MDKFKLVEGTGDCHGCYFNNARYECDIILKLSLEDARKYDCTKDNASRIIVVSRNWVKILKKL